MPVPKNLITVDKKKAEILMEYDPSSSNPKAAGGGARKGRQASHHDDDDYEDEDDMPRGQRVQCNQ